MIKYRIYSSLCIFLFILLFSSCKKTEREIAIEKIKIAKVDSSQLSPEFYAHYEGTWDEKNEAVLDLNSNGRKTKGYLTLKGDSNAVYLLYGTSDTHGNFYLHLFNLERQPQGIIKGVKTQDKLYLIKDSTFTTFINLQENYTKSLKFATISKTDTILANPPQPDPQFILHIHYLYPPETKPEATLLKDSVGKVFFEAYKLKSFDPQNVPVSIDSAYTSAKNQYLAEVAPIKQWNEKNITDFIRDRSIQTEIIYNRNQLVQYYFEAYYFSGKSEWQAGFYHAYDLAAKKRLHIDDIVQDYTGLAKIIGKKVKPMIGSEEPILPLDNFYLNEAGLVLIYTPGTLSMTQVVYVFLPYQDCKPFLKRTL